MTEKEERNFEQKMFDVISTQGAAAAAINCMEIAKDYALCKQVKKLNIDDVSVSDSEIDNYATNQAQEYSDFEGEQIEIAESLSEGAKWMRDKIKNH